MNTTLSIPFPTKCLKAHSPAQPQPSRAKRLECVELAPAVECPGPSKAGASSTHSKRMATEQAPEILAAWVRVGKFRCNVSFRLLVISAWLVMAMTARAGNLYVPNSSFEWQPTAFAVPRVDFWQNPPPPITFDTNIFGALKFPNSHPSCE